VRTNLDAICLDSGSYQVASAWHVRPFTTALRGSDALLGFGRDMVIGASMLPDYEWESNSAVFVGNRGCPEELDRAGAYFEPPPLTVNGQVWLPSSRDGIYGGDVDTQPLGIALDTMRAELTGTVNSSFAVWLHFPRGAKELRATRELATGAWYLPQRITDDHWIVWFEGPLSAGQTIVIEPR
jgi:hypothetical protein